MSFNEFKANNSLLLTANWGINLQNQMNSYFKFMMIKTTAEVKVWSEQAFAIKNN